MVGKRKKSNFLPYIRTLRPTQWIKNLSLFAPIMFAGELDDRFVFQKGLTAFFIFCLLSSASYVINDIVDAPLDRLHPYKKYRPIASGKIKPSSAVYYALGLIFLAFFFSFRLTLGFRLISLLYLAIHLFYSFVLKKKAIYDIVGIALSFIIRVLAGEAATGFHLPIWLMYAVIFLALFIASGKRRNELTSTGQTTRPSLNRYREQLLNFYITMFAVSTLISYAMFAFTVQPVDFGGNLRNILVQTYPKILDRKWMMLTVAPVIFGIMRYGQLIFDAQEGERPEKIVTTDVPLIFAVLFWGLMTAMIIYVF
jgi:decaprenyl-phosphate phosphoribosyltransferase